MKHLCDRCCNARDGAPDINLVACDSGVQVRGPDGEILQCNRFDELPPVQLNLPNRDYKSVHEKAVKFRIEPLSITEEGRLVNGEFEIKEKPPIGVAPYYVTCRFRIKELAQAIARSAIDNSAGKLNGIPKMKLWAKEIIEQCDLIERMKEDEQNQLH